jgi:alpha/beta superfamily hydrolase
MDDRFYLKLTGVQTEPLENNQVRVILSTPDGNMEGVFHPAEGTSAVIWVCGALGGLDGPSFGVFTGVSQSLVSDGISSLRLNYRFPGEFGECVLDVLVGIQFLEQKGKNTIGLVGHSFGGAVVIQAGTMSPRVKTVIGVSSQTYGAQQVAKLAPHPLLLIHGQRDRNLSVRCSQQIYELAKEPKELVIYKGCGHFLRECHQELRDLLRNWLIDKLKGSA